jgi:hypothetical protein
MAQRILPPVLVLGLITVVGPFAIDMYLPALPSMGKSLNASAPAVQMSLIMTAGMKQRLEQGVVAIAQRSLQFCKPTLGDC